MSQKFHINRRGVPAPCRASEGNCPLGGDNGAENHYNSMEEAQQAADEINEKKHEILPKVDSSENGKGRGPAPFGTSNHDTKKRAKHDQDKRTERKFIADDNDNAERSL